MAIGIAESVPDGAFPHPISGTGPGRRIGSVLACRPQYARWWYARLFAWTPTPGDFPMRLDLDLKRTAALALLAAVAMLAAGCDGDDPVPVNAAPTVNVTSPQTDMDVGVGGVVPVTFADDDPDNDAMTDVFADLDGNLATTGDQFALGTDLDEQDGTAKTINWDTTGVPEGAYFIIIVTDDGVNPAVTTVCPGRVSVWNTWPRDHTNILLRDHQGNAIQLGSTEPYSPRETCGACHDIDEIANGYHFQQGRTDQTATIHMKDDFNSDGRTWLKSDGMYGKW